VGAKTKVTLTQKALPDGPWIDTETKKPTPAFNGLLNDLSTGSTVEAQDNSQIKEDLKALSATISKQKDSAKKRVKERVFSSGPLTGQTITIEHKLGTRDIYYSVHKDTQGAFPSFQILDENTVKIKSNISTSYQTIIIYTFE